MFFKLFFFITLIIILLLIYFLGNVVESNINLNYDYINLYYNNKKVDINNIEEYINFKESFIENLILEKKKEIIWFDKKNEQTEYVLYFLHGFNSNKSEGQNFSIKLSKELKANLLLGRLPGNGVYNKEISSNNLNVYHYLRDVYNDLIFLSILGKKIILLGSSTGCTYNIIVSTLFKNKFNIYKNILFSPNLGLNFFQNIGIKFLYSGYGKSIVNLSNDKIIIDKFLVSSDIFIPLIGSLKMYDKIKRDFNNDYIIFISENDSLVSNSKVNDFFNFKNNLKKHYYIFKDLSLHPILFLNNSDNIFIEKIIYFLNNNSEKKIKKYIEL